MYVALSYIIAGTLLIYIFYIYVLYIYTHTQIYLELHAIRNPYAHMLFAGKGQLRVITAYYLLLLRTE